MTDTKDLQVYKATVFDFCVTYEVRYKIYNKLLIAINFDDLYNLFEFELLNEDLRDQFVRLLDTADVRDDNYINYMDVLTFIKQHNYFNMSLALINLFLIKAFAKLKDLYKVPVTEL